MVRSALKRLKSASSVGSLLRYKFVCFKLPNGTSTRSFSWGVPFGARGRELNAGRGKGAAMVGADDTAVDTLGETEADSPPPEDGAPEAGPGAGIGAGTGTTICALALESDVCMGTGIDSGGKTGGPTSVAPRGDVGAGGLGGSGRW